MSDSPDTPKPDLSIVKERPSTIALKAFRKPAETVGEIRESMLTTPTHTIGTIERK
jgi:hypothetical protein